MSGSTFFILVAIGLIAGIASGFVGIGGGVIIVPSLVYIIGLTPLQAQGTSVALMLPPIGILAFMEYYRSGNVNIWFAIVIASAFIIGGLFGAKFAQKLDQNLIKLIFGGVMILAAIKLIIDGSKYFFNQS